MARNADGRAEREASLAEEERRQRMALTGAEEARRGKSHEQDMLLRHNEEVRRGQSHGQDMVLRQSEEARRDGAHNMNMRRMGQAADEFDARRPLRDKQADNEFKRLAEEDAQWKRREMQREAMGAVEAEYDKIDGMHEQSKRKYDSTLAFIAHRMGTDPNFNKTAALQMLNTPEQGARYTDVGRDGQGRMYFQFMDDSGKEGVGFIGTEAVESMLADYYPDTYGDGGTYAKARDRNMRNDYALAKADTDAAKVEQMKLETERKWLNDELKAVGDIIKSLREAAEMMPDKYKEKPRLMQEISEFEQHRKELLRRLSSNRNADEAVPAKGAAEAGGKPGFTIEKDGTLVMNGQRVRKGDEIDDPARGRVIWNGKNFVPVVR